MLKKLSIPPLILHIKDKEKDKKILLGGAKGEYQYKLKTNDVFTLEDPKTGDKVNLRLEESGKLVVDLEHP